MFWIFFSLFIFIIYGVMIQAIYGDNDEQR